MTSYCCWAMNSGFPWLLLLPVPVNSTWLQPAMQSAPGSAGSGRYSAGRTLTTLGIHRGEHGLKLLPSRDAGQDSGRRWCNGLLVPQQQGCGVNRQRSKNLSARRRKDLIMQKPGKPGVFRTHDTSGNATWCDSIDQRLSLPSASYLFRFPASDCSMPAPHLAVRRQRGHTDRAGHRSRPWHRPPGL